MHRPRGTPAYNFGGAGTIYRGSGRQAVGELWIFNDGLANSTTTPALAADDFEMVRVGQGARVDLSGDEIFTADLLRVEDGGNVYIQTTANFAAVEVLSGGLIGHFAGDTGFALSVQGDLHIESGGRITANACGYGPASGPGAGESGGSYSASGGGYGGKGGYSGKGGNGSSSLSGGTAYGDSMRPVWLGSGGGKTTGGAGGGVLRLNISGTLTVDGQLTANGANSTSWGGGGSGGSILLKVGTLAGAGTISANGGAGGHTNYNGGGGGCIAVYSCDVQMSTSLINATGGTGYDTGEDGTIEFGSSTVNINVQPTPQVLRFGDPATLHVAATGIGNLSYQWRRNYQPLENDGNYSGVNTDTLSIAAFAVDAIGLYDVVITDDCGPFTSDYAMLTIPADLDRDGDVDLADLAQLLGHYGTTGGALPEQGDIDGDGDVDLSDLADLLGHYGIGT